MFRTEIEPIKGAKPLGHENKIVMLGSCFTTNVGELMLHDGFDVTLNPMGALYNPMSIASVIARASDMLMYTRDDLYSSGETYHCLDFPNIFQDSDPDRLLERVNTVLSGLTATLQVADTWIITLGTARVYRLIDSGEVVGNCHKLPPSIFSREMISVDDIVRTWAPYTRQHRVIFTVSPIRHVADGLHENQLSKATLLLAVDRLCRETGAEYFPAYEIMMDDLRDYRFYASDMKHPSETAVDYIYEKFSDTYFTPVTRELARKCRKEYRQSQHRPIAEKWN